MALRHHSLVAWQRADDLFIDVHQLTIKRFPRFERYELGGQARKAGYSVPANIAEGAARRTAAGRLYFYNIAESSLAETGYCLHAATRLGYLRPDEEFEWEARVKAVWAPLGGLIRADGGE